MIRAGTVGKGRKKKPTTKIDLHWSALSNLTNSFVVSERKLVVIFSVRIYNKKRDEKPMKEKFITVLICVFGISAVCYGMLRDNNLIFIIGILFIIGGYLLIRRKLKASTRDNS